jgi:GT2 family glycosyltransferase
VKLAIVLVHYHTARLAVAAYKALEADLRTSDLEADWILVDNGSSEEDREILASLNVRRLEPGANLGYAGGANLGVRATDAEAVFLMNPDVEVLPGCTLALLDVLATGVAAAGPRFYWDAGRRFLLPPTECQTRHDELQRLAAERGEFWERRARRSWRRHARRFWTARESFRCYELSGALLAFRRDAWEEVGGFDEGYALYFEETDFLERLRRRGQEAVFVPRAEAVHLYAQSTIAEPRAAGWFVESHRRFRRRFYGKAFTAVLELLDRGWRRRELTRGSSRTFADGVPAWLEVTTSPLGYPAGAQALVGEPSWELDAEIVRRLPAGTYVLRTVAEDGRELEVRSVEIGSA